MPPPTSDPLRVLIVCEAELFSPDLRRDLTEGLQAAGCTVLAVVPAGIAVIDMVAQLGPDLIVIDAESDWRDCLEHVCMATRSAPRPIVLFTENTDTSRAREALASGLTGYVVAGLSAVRIRPVLDIAMARFAIEQELRGELVESRHQLAARKSVEKAKGVLMSRLSLSEQDAFARLRSMAMNRKETLAQAAQRVIAAADLLS